MDACERKARNGELLLHGCPLWGYPSGGVEGGKGWDGILSGVISRLRALTVMARKGEDTNLPGLNYVVELGTELLPRCRIHPPHAAD